MKREEGKIYSNTILLLTCATRIFWFVLFFNRVFRGSTEVFCGCAGKLWYLNNLAVLVQIDVGFCLITTPVCSFVSGRCETCGCLIITGNFSILAPP